MQISVIIIAIVLCLAGCQSNNDDSNNGDVESKEPPRNASTSLGGQPPDAPEEEPTTSRRTPIVVSGRITVSMEYQGIGDDGKMGMVNTNYLSNEDGEYYLWLLDDTVVEGMDKAPSDATVRIPVPASLGTVLINSDTTYEATGFVIDRKEPEETYRGAWEKDPTQNEEEEFEERMKKAVEIIVAKRLSETVATERDGKPVHILRVTRLKPSVRGRDTDD